MILGAIGQAALRSRANLAVDQIVPRLVQGLLQFILFAFLPLLVGCETYSAPNIKASASTARTAKAQLVKIEPCRDLTEMQRARDLGVEGTKALTEKLIASEYFDIGAEAPFLVSCDIERFIEGSAVQRWIAPGWGQTLAQVKIGVWRLPSQDIVATFVSKAQVRAGGLYTIGADQYIIDVAMADIVRQMEIWVGRKETQN